MPVSRAITRKILGLSKKIPVISVTGPRQSGKTTLVKSIFKDYTYTNLENSTERSFAKEDPVAFIAQSNKLIIDEAQRVPELFSQIQVAVDEDKKKKFVLSGSQNFLLHKEISQTLAGRVAIFKLLPFSVGELEPTKYWKKDIDSHILKGFYPRIYDRNIKPEDWYPNYVETYIERDVRSTLRIGEASNFENLVKVCAANTGSVLNYSDLAAKIGVSPNTVKSWISVLKLSYIVFDLKPYFTNISKQLRKSPKIYFYDTGLLCHLLGIKRKAELIRHHLYGQIFENFVIAERIKKNLNDYTHLDFYYLRDKAGNEVDLLYNLEGRQRLVEIKSGTTFKTDYAKGINYYKERIEQKTNGYIVYKGEERQKRTNYMVSNWKEWLENF